METKIWNLNIICLKTLRKCNCVVKWEMPKIWVFPWVLRGFFALSFFLNIRKKPGLEIPAVRQSALKSHGSFIRPFSKATTDTQFKSASLLTAPRGSFWKCNLFLLCLVFLNYGQPRGSNCKDLVKHLAIAKVRWGFPRLCPCSWSSQKGLPLTHSIT